MDMLVHLLDLPAEEPGLTALVQAGIRIRRAIAPDKLREGDWGMRAYRSAAQWRRINFVWWNG